jgi:hypothetical protein
MSSRPDFTLMVRDNETAAAAALQRGDYMQAFLFVHVAVESLLRIFLRVTEEEVTFHSLVARYENFLRDQRAGAPTFVNELTQFNRRRNRMLHQLWRKGYTYTNSQAEGAARGAVMMYGLLIEWLETYDPEITKLGFEYDGA